MTIGDAQVLKRVQIIAAGFFALVLALALVYMRQPQIIGGLVAGGLVGFANFFLLKRIVFKMTSEDENTQEKKSQASLGILFFLKIIILFGVAGLMIGIVGVEPMAFVVGFGSLIVGISFQGLLGLVI